MANGLTAESGLSSTLCYVMQRSFTLPHKAPNPRWTMLPADIQPAVIATVEKRFALSGVAMLVTFFYFMFFTFLLQVGQCSCHVGRFGEKPAPVGDRAGRGDVIYVLYCKTESLNSLKFVIFYLVP